MNGYKRRTVHTQDELDAALADQVWIIRIRSDGRLEVNHTGDSTVRVCGDSRVAVYGVSIVTAADTSRVEAHDFTTVTGEDAATVKAGPYVSVIVLSDRVRVEGGHVSAAYADAKEKD